MSATPSALIYPVRIRTLGKYLGQLLLILAILNCAPLAMAIVHQDYTLVARYATLIIPLSLMGLILSRLRAPKMVQGNEAMVLVCLIFLLGPLFMVYPLTSAGLSTADAFFEAVSGVTTTGLSVLSTTEDVPATYLFSRSWMQWYGGLGIVVLSLAWLIPPGKTAKTLALPESQPEDLVGNTRSFARRILLVYSVLTLVGIVVLWLLGTNFFHSILYSLTAVSTGGFSPHDQSLSQFSHWSPQVFITALALLCAVPLNFYYTTFIYRRSVSVEVGQLVLLFVMGAIVSLVLSYLISQQYSYSASQSLLHGFVNGFSAQTTSGFSSIPTGELKTPAKLLLILAMFLGGGVGSTSGGIKVLRLWIFLASLKYLLTKIALPPHGVSRPGLWKKNFSGEEIQGALTLVLVFILTIIISWILFIAWGFPPIDSLFEVVSAVSTVGLSTGITGPELPNFLKGVLCVDMLLGRLEIIAWLVFLSPRTWYKRNE